MREKNMFHSQVEKETSYRDNGIGIRWNSLKEESLLVVSQNKITYVLKYLIF